MYKKLQDCPYELTITNIRQQNNQIIKTHDSSLYLGFTDETNIFDNNYQSKLYRCDTNGCTMLTSKIDNTAGIIKYNLNRCTKTRFINFYLNDYKILQIHQIYPIFKIYTYIIQHSGPFAIFKTNMGNEITTNTRYTAVKFNNSQIIFYVTKELFLSQTSGNCDIPTNKYIHDLFDNNVLNYYEGHNNLNLFPDQKLFYIDILKASTHDGQYQYYYLYEVNDYTITDSNTDFSYGYGTRFTFGKTIDFYNLEDNNSLGVYEVHL